MNRRGFLSSLGLADSALALDPEKLLWVPGRKLISIPKPQPRPLVVEAWYWSSAVNDLGYRSAVCVDHIFRLEFQGLL